MYWYALGVEGVKVETCFVLCFEIGAILYASLPYSSVFLIPRNGAGQSTAVKRLSPTGYVA